VVTTGAPIGLIPVPADVSVLSVEHTDDPIPRLDGRPNPRRAGWLTVRAPVPRPVDALDLLREPLLAHRAELYQQTGSAIDRSTDPALSAWRHQAAPFLTATSGAAWDVEVTRAG
jgi:hypothetical protein